jgi:hypothetical protein
LLTLQPTKNKFSALVVLGALLIAGLFFFFQSEPNQEKNNLKPSQLDFSKSNQLPTTPTVSKVEASAAPSSVPGSTSAPKITLQAEDLKAWQVFENVLQTKNDNDPRIDQYFKTLNENLRTALIQKYQTFAAEDRNARGLVAFLIARDTNFSNSNGQSAEFLKKVFDEPPCLSLSDCKTIGPDDPHHSGTNQTTLTYPQLATLFQLEARIRNNPELLKDPKAREEFVAILSRAESFAVPAVQERALQIRKEFGL